MTIADVSFDLGEYRLLDDEVRVSWKWDGKGVRFLPSID
jgi:hypothetical protein